MKNGKFWKAMLSVLLGVGIFLVCLFPLRALMNYHEEHHLFRWTGYYLREQLSSWDGTVEYAVSFLIQFFYIGWLGALIVALLTVGLQGLFWWLMKTIRLRSDWFYPLSLAAAVLLFYYAFIPQRYRTEAAFREAVTYDYLVRTHQWEAITDKAAADTPMTEQGVWSTNYALAMRGRLPDDMFNYRQMGLQGLLTDDQQKEVLAYFSLSDIYLQLGLINFAERMAFNAKQYLPDNHKSGRLYRRLAEANILNGNHAIATKYLHFLQSTLFYGQWARTRLANLGSDEEYINSHYGPLLKNRLTQYDGLIPPRRYELIAELVKQNPDNKLAMDYLKAYAEIYHAYKESHTQNLMKENQP